MSYLGSAPMLSPRGAVLSPRSLEKEKERHKEEKEKEKERQREEKEKQKEEKEQEKPKEKKEEEIVSPRTGTLRSRLTTMFSRDTMKRNMCALSYLSLFVAGLASAVLLRICSSMAPTSLNLSVFLTRDSVSSLCCPALKLSRSIALPLFHYRYGKTSL